MNEAANDTLTMFVQKQEYIDKMGKILGYIEGMRTILTDPTFEIKDTKRVVLGLMLINSTINELHNLLTSGDCSA
jgi:hypothetical protein